jgi:hypothetical protein
MTRRLLIVIACLIVSGIVVHHFKVKPPPPMVKPVIATQPASRPATRRAVKPKYPTYMELVRLQNPAVAATQPLDYPVDLPDAAHLVLHDPVYLDPTGNLWITRRDGQPTTKALEKPVESDDHVIQDKPVFVHWWLDSAGNWAAGVVVRDDSGGFDFVTKTDRKHLADHRSFNWSTAFSVLGKIVVATDTGVSVFDVQPAIQEHYHPLPGCGATTNPPAVMLDTRGILAWSPWENGRDGSTGVSRFVDGSWIDLPTPDWPDRPIQLSMLLDGSVLRMSRGIPPSTAPAEGIVDVAPDQFADQIHLSIGQLETSEFDEKHINDLINQLSDADSDQRQAAFDELSRYGPALAPLLEKAAPDQLPEAKMRIRQLLRNKITPALGGLSPVDGRLDVVRRCADGTVIFFAPSGVQVPTEQDEPDVINPAWLALRSDGRMERALPTAMIQDQKPDACTLTSVHDEWVINDDAGPRHWVGSKFEPLLSPEEKRFGELVGIGTRRRWVFRSSDGDTLIIDPGIADPTPKLPVWTIVTPKGTAGWDSANFPAVARPENEGNWELDAEGWKPVAAAEKVVTELPACTQPTSLPTTASAKGKTLLITPDGSEFFDGSTSLVMVKKSGEQINWPLPAAAVGSVNPVLMQTPEGLLFLYNQPGRLLRIRPTPAASEPFKLEATFTKDIPNADHPARVWLDPAGRIVFVTETNILTVTFPSGVIPKPISRMMVDDH